MAQKVSAWERLVAQGLLASRAEAERWILAGKVSSGGVPVKSCGQRVPADAELCVQGLLDRYVSRGGLKLEGALDAFGVDPSGRVCLDAGASTGGFTDCLLQRGAALVYAVDVGFGQLAGSLRANPRVVNMERTNLGDASLLALSPRPTLAAADLSYLSLRRAVPLYARAMAGKGDLICLVKPLFEVDDSDARRTGVIAQSAYLPLLLSLCEAFVADGYAVRGVTHSPVTGNGGTREFFLHLAFAGESLPPETLSIAAEAAVSAALALP